MVWGKFFLISERKNLSTPADVGETNYGQCHFCEDKFDGIFSAANYTLNSMTPFCLHLPSQAPPKQFIKGPKVFMVLDNTLDKAVPDMFLAVLAEDTQLEGMLME